MLEIVITHYTEPWETGEKLFRMIGLQRCIDFGEITVTVVNDGGHRLPADQLDALPYKVEQLDIPHGGVSAARNAGIDHGTEKWIMFCDFDDTFPTVYALREYLGMLSGAGDRYDMLWVSLVAEDYTGENRILYRTPESQRFVFCHGKAYRRAFLNEANVRFDESLRFNEDSCFNAIIVARTDFRRIGEIRSDIPLYAWIRRDGSVTTSGREDEAALGHFHRNLKVTAEYEGRDDERFRGMVTRSVYDTYYMIHGNRISAAAKFGIIQAFAPWIRERIGAYGLVPEEFMGKIRSMARMELYSAEEPIPEDPESVGAWARKIAREG